MSDTPDISFELVDPSTMSPLRGNLNLADNRVFRPIFNGPGSFSCTVKLDSDVARLVRKRSTGVLFIRNDDPIWSGGVTSIQKTAGSNQCTITATGWLEELEHRQIWRVNEPSLQFAAPGVPGGQIIHAIIDAINSQEVPTGVPRPVRIMPGSVFDTQTRTGSYKQGDNAWQKINELIEIENGCEIRVNPTTMRLDTYPPDAFTVRESIQFGWGVDPHNLGDLDEVDDGSSQGNVQSVVASNGSVYTAYDEAAIYDAGVMLETWGSIPVLDSTIVEAFANAELAVHAYGKKTWRLSPKSFGDMPRPYDDFNWGDICFLSADQGALQIDHQAIRMQSATLTYDDKGHEVISDLQVFG
jgi:hypothetical protein